LSPNASLANNPILASDPTGAAKTILGEIYENTGKVSEVVIQDTKPESALKKLLIVVYFYWLLQVPGHRIILEEFSE
jgi:hypothetical protein